MRSNSLVITKIVNALANPGQIILSDLTKILENHTRYLKVTLSCGINHRRTLQNLIKIILHWFLYGENAL